MRDAIVVDRIGRWFGPAGARVHALRDVSFRVEVGQVVALLGANGAGKTTLAKILSTLLEPSEGRAFVMGTDVVADPRGARSGMSVVFGGERGLYPRLSGRDNLTFFATLAGVGRRDLRVRGPELLDRVGLTAAADRRVETYSKGMRQRLHLAIGVISRPRVLLLDEPTVGLDPTEAQRLRDTVGEMRGDGVSVLLTSHYLLDVEKLADRVVMLDGGSITLDVPLHEFAQTAGRVARCEVDFRGPFDDALLVRRGIDVLDRSQRDGISTVVLGVPRWSRDTLDELLSILRTVDLVDLRVVPTSLEDSYAAVVAGRT